MMTQYHIPIYLAIGWLVFGAIAVYGLWGGLRLWDEYQRWKRK